MLYVAMAKVGLEGARIVSLIGERVAAGVPEHVRVRLEPKFAFGARAFDHAGKPRRRERRAPLADEQERRFGLCSRWSRRSARSSSPTIGCVCWGCPS